MYSSWRRKLREALSETLYGIEIQAWNELSEGKGGPDDKLKADIREKIQRLLEDGDESAIDDSYDTWQLGPYADKPW